MNKIRLLYIEDDAVERVSTTKKLRMKNFTVTPAASGRSGLKLLKSREFDAVLCDLNMPGVGGERVLKALRKTGSNIPFIIMTGHGTVREAVRALREGADHFILKPGDIDEISNSFGQIIEKRALEKRLLESESMLKTVTDNVADVIYSLDPAGEFVSLSPSVKKALGYRPDELLGKRVLDIVHPDERKKIVAAFSRPDERRRTTVVRLRMVSKSGKTSIHEVKNTPVFKGRKIVRHDGVVRDVSKQVELEDKLKEYSAGLEKMVEERTGRLEFVNRQLTALNAASKRLGRLTKEKDLLDIAPKLLTRALDFDRAYLCTLVDGRIHIHSFCPGGGPRKPLLKFTRQVNSGKVKLPPHFMQSFRQGKTIFVPDIRRDRRWVRKPPFMTKAKSIVIAPVKTRGSGGSEAIIVGSMHDHDRDMDRNDVKRFETFVNMVSLALENIKAYQGLENKVRERTESLRSTNKDLKDKAKLLEDTRLEIAAANLELLGAQEELQIRAEELSIKNDQLNTILEATDRTILFVDSGGVVRVCNNMSVTHFGIEPARIIGKKFDDIKKRVSRLFAEPERFIKLMKQIEMRPDTAHDYDLGRVFQRSLPMKGKRKEQLVTPFCLPILGDDGTKQGMIWFFFDVANIKRSNEQVYAIVNASPIPVLISRIRDNKLIFANEKLAELTGIESKKLVGSNARELFDVGDDAEYVRKRLERDGAISGFETRLVCADGSHVWVTLSLVTTEIGGEKVYLGGMYDLSERKRFEEELAGERNFVSAVLDTAGALIVVLDPDGKVIRFNRTSERVSGYKFSELEGKTFQDILIPEDEREMLQERFEKLRQGVSVDGENHWLTRDGEKRLISWSNTTLKGDGGEVRYVVAIGIDITEHREAEEKVRLYREIFMKAQDSIVIASPDGEYLESNPAHKRFSGLSEEEMSSAKGFELVRDSKEDVMRQISTTGSYRGELEAPDKNGRMRYFDFGLFPVTKEDGDILCYASISRDITKRKTDEQVIRKRLRYEEALAACTRTILTGGDPEKVLREALGYLRVAAEVSHVYVLGLVEEGNLDAGVRMIAQVHENADLRADKADLKTIHSYDLATDWLKKISEGEPIIGNLKDFRDEVAKMLAAKGIYSILYIPIFIESTFYGCIGFDDEAGEREWKDDDVRLLKTASELLGIYFEQRRYAEAIRVSEERFRGLVENANEVIFSVSPEGDFTYISPSFERIFGRKVSDLIGRPFFNIIHEDDIEGAGKWFSDVLEGKTETDAHELRMLHRDGSVRWIHSRASIIRDEEDKVLDIIGVAHDITEIKLVMGELAEANRHIQETQAQLAQSEKMASLGMLVAGIAHEINTPIGAVTSMHDTLVRSIKKLREVVSPGFIEGHPDAEKIRRLLGIIDESNEVIESGSSRVVNIVKRLRSFARLDEAELKAVDIHEGIEDTLMLVHHELKHGITVVRDFAEIPPVACYPGQLNQVFLNIIINAKQAMKGEGTIEISSRIEDGMVKIRFRDSGPGISREDLERIFDPGFTTKGVGVGTGLGLSICYQIMQDHRGGISAESEPGKGTTFTVSLPINLEELLEVHGGRNLNE